MNLCVKFDYNKKKLEWANERSSIEFWFFLFLVDGRMVGKKIKKKSSFLLLQKTVRFLLALNCEFATRHLHLEFFFLFVFFRLPSIGAISFYIGAIRYSQFAFTLAIDVCNKVLRLPPKIYRPLISLSESDYWLLSISVWVHGKNFIMSKMWWWNEYKGGELTFLSKM